MFSRDSIPEPTLTEKNAESQEGRVFIVTGGYTGIGFELSKILYHLNGRVYIAGRSESKARDAIAAIEASRPASGQRFQGGKGSVRFLSLNLDDLPTIKGSAESFLAQEDRLDVIWHNAGVMIPPDGTETKQGFEAQMGTNALGHWLFQHFLTPLCLKTASRPDVSKNATRVVFVTSNAHVLGPKPDGVNWDDLNMKEQTGFQARLAKYGQSKAMNVMHAHEMARRYGPGGLTSVSVHTGSLKTNLQRDLPWYLNVYFRWFRQHPHEGAISELFAGLCPEVDKTMLAEGGHNGAYIVPWGRFASGDEQIFEGLTKRETGQKLWKLCEDLLASYM